MGLFRKKDPDRRLPTIDQSPVDLSSVRLDCLLMTSGGAYENRVHSDHVHACAAAIRKHFGAYRYPNWWEGTAYLVPGTNNGHDVIWVRALGHNVDKVTKETVDRLRGLVTSPVPVRCRLTMISDDAMHPKPSVSIWGVSSNPS